MRDHRVPPINSGMYWSRTGSIGFEEFAELAELARKQLDSFAYGQYDQPFLNWLVTEAALGPRPLEPLVDRVFLWAGTPISLKADHRQQQVVYRAGRHIGTAWPIPGMRVASIHWAGFGIGERLPYRSVWREFAPARPATAILRTQQSIERASMAVARLRRRIGSSLRRNYR